MPNEYFSKYVSPNIVIVPTVSFTHNKPPAKKDKIIDTQESVIKSDEAQSSNIQPLSSSVLQSSSNILIDTSSNTREVVTLSDISSVNINDKFNSSEEGNNNKEETVIKASEVTQSENNGSVSLDTCKDYKKPCVSWASNYLLSIGQSAKPIKLNLSSSRNKILQKLEKERENEADELKINSYLSKVNECDVKKIGLPSPPTTNFSSSINFKSRIDARAYFTQTKKPGNLPRQNNNILNPVIQRKQNKSYTPLLINTNLKTLSDSNKNPKVYNNNTPTPQNSNTKILLLNSNTTMEPKNTKKHAEPYKRLNKENGDKKMEVDKAIKAKPISLSSTQDYKESSLINKQTILKKNMREAFETKDTAKLSEHSNNKKLISSNDSIKHLKYSASRKDKDTSDLLSKSVKKREFTKSLVKIKTKRKLGDRLTNTLPINNNHDKCDSEKKTNTDINVKNIKLNHKRRCSSPETQQKKRICQNPGQNMHTIPSKIVKSHPNKTPEQLAKMSLQGNSGNRNSDATVNNKVKHSVIERPLKKINLSESENGNYKLAKSTTLLHSFKSDNSDRLKMKRVRHNSENEKQSHNYSKKEACSDNPESIQNKRCRRSSENANNQDSITKKRSPIKSVVQVRGADKILGKHPRIQPPESDNSDNENESNFDLRSRLSRMNYKRYSENSLLFYDDQSKPLKNLVITVNQNNEETNTKLPPPGPSKLKLKSKKCKKIQLIINVTCQESEDGSESSSSSDTNSTEADENYSLRNLDLSFLDDFNIEEIVNCLKNSPKLDNNVNQPTSINNIDAIKRSPESSINEFVQPIIIKDEVKTEPSEKEARLNTLQNYISSKISTESSQENKSIGLISSSSDCIKPKQDSGNTELSNKNCLKTSTNLNDNSKNDDNEANMNQIIDAPLDNTQAIGINTCSKYDIKPETSENESNNNNLEHNIIAEKTVVDDQDIVDLTEDKLMPLDINIQNEVFVPKNTQEDKEDELQENNNNKIKTSSDGSYVERECSKNNNYLKQENILGTSLIAEDVVEIVENHVLIDLTEDKTRSLDINTQHEVSVPKNTTKDEKKCFDEELQGKNNREIKTSSNENDVKRECNESENDDNLKQDHCLKTTIITEDVLETVDAQVSIDLTDENTVPLETNIQQASVTKNSQDDKKCLDEELQEQVSNEVKRPSKEEVPINEEVVTETIAPPVLKKDKKPAKTQKKPLLETPQETIEDKNIKLRKNINADKNLKIDSNIILSPENKAIVSEIENRVFNYLHERVTVTSCIHQGKFSKVFKCQNFHGQHYAIKMLKNAAHRQPLGIQKEKMLTQIQKDIPIENLNTVYFINGFGLGRNWCFLMEYYPWNLKEALIERGKPFLVDDVQILARQLVSAIMLLRNNNIVHSDIKPPHILLDASKQRLKLCGFDGSYYAGWENVIPNIGTLAYRAPEIIIGYSAGFSIDVWSTALIIYEMATTYKLFNNAIYNNEVLYKQMCLFGNMPMDIVQNGGSYAAKHFLGHLFMKRSGYGGKNVVFVPRFYKTKKLQNCLFNAYNKFWSSSRTKLQRKSDLTTLASMHSLLEQMLILDPRRRLAIEFVYADPFIYEMLS